MKKPTGDFMSRRHPAKHYRPRRIMCYDEWCMETHATNSYLPFNLKKGEVTGLTEPSDQNYERYVKRLTNLNNKLEEELRKSAEKQARPHPLLESLLGLQDFVQTVLRAIGVNLR